MDTEERTFRVRGLHCAGCVSKIEATVAALDGVQSVQVSLEPGLARAVFDPSRITPETVSASIAALGYTVDDVGPGEPSRVTRACAAARSPMTLAVAVWLCTLPFVFLLLVPWRGARAAVTGAVLLLVGITAVCWTLCAAGRARHAKETR